MRKARVLPHPRWKIEDGLIKAEGLISISPSESAYQEAPIPQENFGEILMLRFDDIPIASLWEKNQRFFGPSVEAVRAATAFGLMILKKKGTLAVNCAAGKSRSPALALAIEATLAKDEVGNGHEGTVVKNLLAHDVTHQMCFNPRIIDIANILLKNDRGLHNALERLCAPYRSWRRYWEKRLDGEQGITQIEA